MVGKRILILVAHPDDEVVACCAAVSRARAEGAEIFALYLTHGCLAREVMWPWKRKDYQRIVDTRRAEGEAAATLMGIQPLGWSTRPARYLWRELPMVFQEIEAAMGRCRPDQLWVPAYEGGNPDHDALNGIGSMFKKQIDVVEFAEYTYCAGKAQSHNFICRDSSEVIIDLSANEREAKRAALDIYKSERSNLSAIELLQECYRPLAVYNYAQPPHQGQLWYERFRWVPFRHPRIDYSDNSEISKAILSFLSGR